MMSSINTHVSWVRTVGFRNALIACILSKTRNSIGGSNDLNNEWSAGLQMNAMNTLDLFNCI